MYEWGYPCCVMLCCAVLGQANMLAVACLSFCRSIVHHPPTSIPRTQATSMNDNCMNQPPPSEGYMTEEAILAVIEAARKKAVKKPCELPAGGEQKVCSTFS